MNVADRDDFVAAAPDLTPLFANGRPAEALFEGGWTVNNGVEPHRATFYLTKQQTARPHRADPHPRLNTRHANLTRI